MYKDKKAFSLIELIVSLTIVSIILVSWFLAYIRIWYWKISLIQQTEIQKNSFYFSERLFQLIKEGGLIDYEEYFNRKLIWTWVTNWHFSEKSWFWNYWSWGNVWDSDYWDWYYYCRSESWQKMWNNWCYSDNNLNTNSNSPSGIWYNYSWSQQRYWQYSFQFIDYNSNANNDLWDEDWDGKIIWDYDDEYLGAWPEVFSFWENVHELYLISWDKKTRTLIRWNIKEDDNAPEWVLCDLTSTDSMTSELKKWCIWTIEFLKLTWEDWGLDHDIRYIDNDWTQYDWVIDTWLVDKEFTNLEEVIAWAVDMEQYWTNLFPSSVSVSDFEVYVFPNIDYKNAWKLSSEWKNISPYVIISYKIMPSWESRWKINTEVKEISMSATINLTEIFSN